MNSFLSALLLLSFATQALAGEPPPNFFLPQNPVAAAYVLGRLSNQELVAAPRGEFVYVALLQRVGLERKYRVEALEGLAKIRHTTSLAELLAALGELDKKGEDSLAVLRDLAPVLTATAPADLRAKRPALEKLAAESQLPLTRQIAYAALVAADASGRQAWQAASASQRADLVRAIPLIRDASLRAEFYSRLEPLIRGNDSPELRRAAITALPAVPGHDAESFKTLATLVAEKIETKSALAALQQIPQNAWPKDTASSLLTNVLAFLQQVPPAERTDSDFAGAVQFATQLANLLPDERTKRDITRTLRGLGPSFVTLRAVYEQMRYDLPIFAVQAGKPVAITLDNQDAMPHNLVILKPGALEEIGLAAETMPATPDAEGRLYVPSSSKVLHATKLVTPGQKAQLVFTAPSEPGEYPYVCTFPGHWRRMTGTMAVVQDVDAWLAAHAQAEQPKLTEWKLEDLAPNLSRVAAGRDLAAGQKLFTQLACVQCHKLAKLGYAYGPDLTGVFAKYKNDRAAVLDQILEPSKLIEERYRTFEFELGDDESLLGFVLKEDADTVTIQTGPADSLIQTLKKSVVHQRRVRNSSPMPLGLLNTLSRDQIFDLLAFIEAGGAVPAHNHPH